MDKALKSLRGKALSIMRSSIRACDPFGAIGKQVKLKGARLTVDRRAYDLDRVRQILLIGAGKASARMAQALEHILADRIDSGLVITKTCHRVPLGGKIELVEGGHPLPDINGKRATERIVKLLSKTTADDVVIFLLSGGGSALLVSPVPGITLKETIKLTKELLRCGADIKEMNALRKHISQVKGGRLAEVAQPARVVSLILSDVIGDRLDSIGSGPTAPDRTTFGDCLRIVEKYRLKNRIPASIYRHLKRAAQGKIKETPKPGDPIFRRVKNVIIGSNRMALGGAKKRAEELGFNTFVFPRPVAGDTTRAAQMHVQLLKMIRDRKDPIRPPACIISGGETTVTIRGEGLGGRNQEFALVGALGIAGMRDVVLLSAGTDGTDGPTDAAGAVCDGDTVAQASALGLNPEQYLAQNDSYHFFHRLGDLIITGPTHTNVMDVHLALIGA